AWFWSGNCTLTMNSAGRGNRSGLGRWPYAERMSQVTPGPDPLMPLTSRFPRSPSGPGTRPFGMRFAVRAVERGEHSKRPTDKTRSERTRYGEDQQFKVQADVVQY